MSQAGSNGRRRALVTGAGAGIGRATAELLARDGFSVVATVRDAGRARERTAQACGRGLDLRYLPLELTDPAQVDAVAGEAEASGGVDLLVHNAGFGVYGAVEDVDASAAVRQFAVNVFGPLSLTRLLLPGLRSRRGQIIWVGSLAGRIPLPFQAHYSASKAAVATLSDVLRMELAPHGVRVTCVEPSDFSTGFTDARVDLRRAGSSYAETAARCLKEVERQERGAPDPERVARAIARLAAHPSPPARLPVGQNAGLICLLMRLLPARMAERMIRAHYKV